MENKNEEIEALKFFYEEFLCNYNNEKEASEAFDSFEE